MLLKRIQEISNIGKFCNCKGKGLAGIEFFPETVIFGKNGNGKSTFTSILRSLQTGNNQLLIGKKTLGSTGSKKVDLDFENDGKALKAKFENKKWNIAPNERIFIFDTKFIAENIFDGENIEDDHKANLHKVVVGEEGKKYALAVSALAVKIKGCGRTKDASVVEYSRSPFARKFTLDQFLALPKNKDIDARIDEKKQELQFANQINKPSNLTVDTPNLEEVADTLNKKVSTVHASAEGIIKSHCKAHTQEPETAIRWLNQGKNLSKGNDCPYCGQDTTGVSDLISSYKAYFDNSYQDLQREISRITTNFTDWDVAQMTEAILSEAEDWNNIIKKQGAYEELVVNVRNSDLGLKKDALQVEIEKKSKDFNYLVPDATVVAVVGELTKIQTSVDSYNSEIDKFKLKINSKKPQEIEEELFILNITKERHEPRWSKFCSDYVDNEKNTSAFKDERKKAAKELSDYSQKTFSTYQESINKVLERIGADFRIKDLCEQQDHRKAEAIFCGFELEFFGKHVVELDGTEDKPHFRNTLSEGDKGSLAFAFFISLLSNSENLKDCLVVFDDPISSFDSDRKKSTAQILSTIKNTKKESPEQIIVLTHESNFLIKLNKEFPSALYLRISPDGINSSSVKQSTIERLDVYESFLKPEAFEALERMKKCVDGNDPVDSKAHEDCRIVLENALEAKYYLKLKGDMLLHKGLGGYIDTLVGGGQMEQDFGDEFKKMLSDIHEPHHKSTEASKGSNSEGDIKAIIRTSLDLLKRL